ncbi:MULTISPECIES: alpha/beta hydrolase-fold protein [unclassified Brenneria]|uniref:alpha/beta hydrolase n=1 Tax=unclassified Brenneria TaxID=2634434 RepID=UPI0029C3AF75|nr:MULTISPECIES: alpha/beta hydrolase-fold protein [unclassified Brenneria]MDX5628894.1 alpha/beta hydrolase-fold protein [Brenneria sp. L3-3Z]MDX5696033.1 alpha/beta hydrolase-fold protein [Brenneria sp. L4-2C]MEE3661116.1 alpha/beta hydrolase-fold protein [Brenneria sp. g21c3]
MYQLRNTRDEIFDSAACGRYRVLSFCPASAPPPQGWPVIYLLDGARYFPVAVSLMDALAGPRCGMTPGIIVALDYEGPTRRERDYRPAVARIVPEANPAGGYYPSGMAGDAAGFRRFMQAELKPFIAAGYAVDSRREALFGHSYGGLFTVDTLFAAPNAFQHFYASSPSVWWNGGYLMQQVEPFLATSALQRMRPISLALSVGEYEQSLERWELGLPDAQRQALRQHRHQRRMVDGIRELAWTLQKRSPNLRVTLDIYPQQSHQSAPLFALQHALRTHFQQDLPAGE